MLGAKMYFLHKVKLIESRWTSYITYFGVYLDEIITIKQCIFNAFAVFINFWMLVATHEKAGHLIVRNHQHISDISEILEY